MKKNYWPPSNLQNSITFLFIVRLGLVYCFWYSNRCKFCQKFINESFAMIESVSHVLFNNASKTCIERNAQKLYVTANKMKKRCIVKIFSKHLLCINRSFSKHLDKCCFLIFSLLHPFSDYYFIPIIFRFAYEGEN